MAHLNAQLETVSGSVIRIDFSHCTWIDANMAAPLGGIFDRARSRGNSIRFLNISSNIKIALARNGFVHPILADVNGTTIPYKQFTIDMAKEFAGYTDTHLMGKGMPKMSPGLRNRFLLALDELFQNAAMHSKTIFGIFCCGQFFPKKQKLIFVFVDMGIGFKQNILERAEVDLPADDAIEWALTGDNTTRKLDIPGGMGLKLLREFIELNGGKLTIASHRGYCDLDSSGISKHILPSAYPGTAISLLINTADRNSYYLAEEQADDLF